MPFSSNFQLVSWSRKKKMRCSAPTFIWRTLSYRVYSVLWILSFHILLPPVPLIKKESLFIPFSSLATTISLIEQCLVFWLFLLIASAHPPSSYLRLAISSTFSICIALCKRNLTRTINISHAIISGGDLMYGYCYGSTRLQMRNTLHIS